MTTTTRPQPDIDTDAIVDQADDAAKDAVRTARDTVGDVADNVRSVAGDVAARIPDAAATTRQAIAEADRQMRAGSDEMLTAGMTLSFGFAMGLLLGRANRILVALSLIPAAAMGLTLLDRNTARKPASAARH